MLRGLRIWLSIVLGRIIDPVLPAEVIDFDAALRLFQDRDNLRLTQSAGFHKNRLGAYARKLYFSPVLVLGKLAPSFHLGLARDIMIETTILCDEVAARGLEACSKNFNRWFGDGGYGVVGARDFGQAYSHPGSASAGSHPGDLSEFSACADGVGFEYCDRPH